MSSFSDRIRTLRGSISSKDFADKLDISVGALNNYENGKTTPNDNKIKNIAMVLNVSPEWLRTGIKEDYTYKNENNEFTTISFVHVPLVSAVLAAGSGSCETEGNILGYYAFRSDWIYGKGNPKNMVLMQVAGDSMYPKIENKDVVLIDQDKTRIIPYGIFAIGIEDAIFVKQLQLKPGKLVLHSLNPEYEDFEVDISAEQPENIRIIGRVLWVGKELD